MNCEPLALTGLGANVGFFLALGILCLLVGAGLLLHARNRRAAAASLAVLGLVVAGLTLAPAPPGHAAPSDCASATAIPIARSDTSLTVTQTSTMEGLAPGRAPAPITGLVGNNGTTETHVSAVLVEIASVTAAPSAPAGACNASDYLLLRPRMRVDMTLGPGSSAPFAGASIGFRNKAANQDACKLATVHLLYTANPA